MPLDAFASITIGARGAEYLAAFVKKVSDDAAHCPPIPFTDGIRRDVARDADSRSAVRVEQVDCLLDDMSQVGRLAVEVDRAHRDPRGIRERFDHEIHFLRRDQGAVDRLGKLDDVERGPSKPPRRKDERTLEKSERLTDVMKCGSEKLVANGLDPIRQGGQCDHGCPIERVVDYHDRADDVTCRKVIVDMLAEIPGDLLPKEPELRRDRDWTEALFKAGLGMGLGSTYDRIVVEGRLKGLVAVRGWGLSMPTTTVCNKVPRPFGISQNLVWATGYNLVAIPIAMGVLVPWGIGKRSSDPAEPSVAAPAAGTSRFIRRPSAASSS